jgi:HrpA-like RNA helicase
MAAAAAAKASGAALSRFARVRAALPVASYKDRVLSALAESQVVLLSGGTGCGKTTQVPQFILEDAIARGAGAALCMVCTQPRRIAATGVAARVAAERDESLGDVVGYHIKGERRAGPRTALLFCTTGILLRRLVGGLGACTHIIVDEVHERSVETDFLLAVLRRVLPARPDVKVLLMSATMDAGAFARYFAARARGGTVPTIEVPGFTHPVTDVYLEDVLRLTGFRPALRRGRGGGEGGGGAGAAAGGDAPDGGGGGDADAGGGDTLEGAAAASSADADLRAWRSHGLDYGLAAATVHMIVNGSGGVAAERAAAGRAVDATLGAADAGAVLVFLPGVAEIRRLQREIERTGPTARLHVLTLHGQLSAAEQSRVFERAPAGKRKVILCTNVAETSVTIDDVTVVVDTFRVKEAQFDALNGVGRLVETWTSQASSKQRRGRAGRTRPGVCYRLVPRAMHDSLAAATTPEIVRSPLEDIVLQVRCARAPTIVRLRLSVTPAPYPRHSSFNGSPLGPRPAPRARRRFHALAPRPAPPRRARGSAVDSPRTRRDAPRRRPGRERRRRAHAPRRPPRAPRRRAAPRQVPRLRRAPALPRPHPHHRRSARGQVSLPPAPARRRRARARANRRDARGVRVGAVRPPRSGARFQRMESCGGRCRAARVR